MVVSKCSEIVVSMVGMVGMVASPPPSCNGVDAPDAPRGEREPRGDVATDDDPDLYPSTFALSVLKEFHTINAVHSV